MLQKPCVKKNSSIIVHSYVIFDDKNDYYNTNVTICIIIVGQWKTIYLLFFVFVFMFLLLNFQILCNFSN